MWAQSAELLMFQDSESPKPFLTIIAENLQLAGTLDAVEEAWTNSFSPWTQAEAVPGAHTCNKPGCPNSEGDHH